MEKSVRLPAGDGFIEGDLAIPAGARGAVLFAHGSGSSRHSPRNRAVADFLRRGQLATLLIDLLTPDEERLDAADGHLRFDIDLLSRRLLGAIDWLTGADNTRRLPIGLFGASTGAAAALVSAARRPALIGAVVSRGGRPDLARESLALVRAPTLMIVGGEDTPVIGMNRSAAALMRTEKEVVIVPGATHLFEEPGALDEVARLASDWFRRHLVGPKPA